MTEEIVRVANDNGAKDRWGVGRFLYRQDGKKRTVQTKWLLWGIGGAFGFSTILVLVKGPTQLEIRSPITFDGIVSPTSSVEVPEAASETPSEKRSRLRGGKAQVRTYTPLSKGSKRNRARNLMMSILVKRLQALPHLRSAAFGFRLKLKARNT